MSSPGSSHGFRRVALESRVEIPDLSMASQRSPLAPRGESRGIPCTCENAIQVPMLSHTAARGEICGNNVLSFVFFCQWGDPWVLDNSRGPMVLHGSPRDLVRDPMCEVLKRHRLWGISALLPCGSFSQTSRMIHMSICRIRHGILPFHHIPTSALN